MHNRPLVILVLYALLFVAACENDKQKEKVSDSDTIEEITPNPCTGQEVHLADVTKKDENNFLTPLDISCSGGFWKVEASDGYIDNKAERVIVDKWDLVTGVFAGSSWEMIKLDWRDWAVEISPEEVGFECDTDRYTTTFAAFPFVGENTMGEVSSGGSWGLDKSWFTVKDGQLHANMVLEKVDSKAEAGAILFCNAYTGATMGPLDMVVTESSATYDGPWPYDIGGTHELLLGMAVRDTTGEIVAAHGFGY